MGLFRKIRTRIALSFSLLFIVVGVPVIIYALHKTQLFFEGLYLKQMEAAGLTYAALFPSLPISDDLLAKISDITSSSILLISESGEIMSSRFLDQPQDADTSVFLPTIKPGAGKIEHEFVETKTGRYLKVQIGLDGNKKLVMARSLNAVSVLIVRMREVVIWSSFLLFLAMVAVSFWVSSNITHHLEKLTTFTKKIKEGNISHKTDIKSPDEIGELANAINGIVDNLQEAQKRTDHQQRERRELLCGIYLDLKTSLAVFEDLFLSKQRKDESDYLDSMFSQLMKAKEATIHLLAVCGGGFDKDSLNIQSFKLADFVSSVAKLFEKQISRKKLKIRMILDAQKALIFGDEELLKTAMASLLSAIIDLSQQEGSLEIACVDENDKVKVWVESSNLKLSYQEINTLLQTEEKESKVSEIQNFVFELRVAKEIIKSHGQNLAIEQEVENKCKFSFSLPKTSEIG